MGKISGEVSKGLSTAIAEAKAKMNGETNEENSVEELLNSGAEVQKKRKRRTKAEIEAAKTESKENSLFETFDLSEEEDNRPEWEKRHARTHEEFCQWELEKAKLKGLPEPDFDFRNYYEHGEIVYYVRYSELLGVKEIHKVYLRTIDPRMMVGSQEKSHCHCIGYNQRDQVFRTPKEANDFYNSLQIVQKYNTKSKQKDSDDEDDNEIYEKSMEVEDED